jgi:hypothetical protein
MDLRVEANKFFFLREIRGEGGYWPQDTTIKMYWSRARG